MLICTPGGGIYTWLQMTKGDKNALNIQQAFHQIAVDMNADRILLYLVCCYHHGGDDQNGIPGQSARHCT